MDFRKYTKEICISVGAVALALALGTGLAMSSPAYADNPADDDWPYVGVVCSEHQAYVVDCIDAEENNDSVQAAVDDWFLIASDSDMVCTSVSAEASVFGDAKSEILSGNVLEEGVGNVKTANAKSSGCVLVETNVYASGSIKLE